MSRRALILLALIATEARAESWDGGFAYGGGVETIGGETYAGMLVQIQVSRRVLPRVGLSATGEFSGVHDDAIEGAVVRGLLAVDVHVVRATKGFSPNLLVSVGSGTETIMWDRGTLTRPVSSLGVEVRMRMTIEPGGFIRHASSFGARFGIRGHLAPGTATETVAKLCTACDSIEPADPGLDIGVAFYMGLVFGR